MARPPADQRDEIVEQRHCRSPSAGVPLEAVGDGLDWARTRPRADEIHDANLRMGRVAYRLERHPAPTRASQPLAVVRERPKPSDAGYWSLRRTRPWPRRRGGSRRVVRSTPQDRRGRPWHRSSWWPFEHAQDGSFVVAVPDHTDRSLHRDVKRVVVSKPLRGRASRFLVQGRGARPNSVAGSRARENTPMRGRRHRLDQAQSRRTPDGSPGQDQPGIAIATMTLFTSPVVIFDGSAYAFDDGAPGGGATDRTRAAVA